MIPPVWILYGLAVYGGWALLVATCDWLLGLDDFDPWEEDDA